MVRLYEKNTWVFSVFRRLFLTFLLIMLPIYGVGFYIYYWGSNAIQNELRMSVKAQGDFVIDKMETSINKLKILQYDCLKNRNLQNLVNLSDITSERVKYEAFTNMHSQLTTIYLSDSFIKDVVVYMPTVEEQYSVSKGIESLDDDKYQMYKNASSVLLFENGRITLSNTYPAAYLLENTGSEATAEPTAVLTIEISERGFLEAIELPDIYEGNCFILTDGKSIISGSRYQLLGQLSEEDINGILSHSPGEKIFTEKNGNRFLTVYSRSEELGFTLINFIPEKEIFGGLEVYSIYLRIFIILSVIIILLYSVSTYRFIHVPIKKLISSFREVEKGNMTHTVHHMHNDEFKYLYQKFNEMLEKINQLVNQNYKQKILLQQTELKHLQSQINPHFLYNSLFMLKRMIMSKDLDNAQRLSDHLGEYFQFITRDKEEQIPLEIEMAHAQTYANIQSMRFRGRIRIYIEELPKEYGKLYVPRLIIQPLIENAFEHGLKNKAEEGIINLTYRFSKEEISIFVDDNGDSADDDTIRDLQQSLQMNHVETDCTALYNIHARIAMRFGEGSGLQVSRNFMGGFSVQLKLISPFLFEEKE